MKIPSIFVGCGPFGLQRLRVLIEKTNLRIEGRTCFVGEIGLEGNQVAFQVNESIVEAVKLIGKKHG